MSELTLRYLSGHDVAELALGDDEILGAVEQGLIAQGRGDTVIEPRAHLLPGRQINGHFNVLRGYLGPLGCAGVKVVGDYVDNYRRGLPSEFGILNLFDADTGRPTALLDATGITEMRTGAVTALAAKHLARRDARVLGHIGARGTAYWNVRLLDRLFEFDEIRIHSRRAESREAFATTLRRDLHTPVVVTDNWRDCLDGADILVEASRLQRPEPLFQTRWIKPGALAVPYGTMSTVEDDITDVIDKLVVDDWGQCLIGPFGCLRRHVDDGRVSRDTLHGELGEVCAGRIPGRERDDERILVWHRGLSTSDIALGHAMLQKAERLGIGHVLPYR